MTSEEELSAGVKLLIQHQLCLLVKNHAGYLNKTVSDNDVLAALESALKMTL